MLIKLFYQNGENLLIALREYLRLNCLQKGPMAGFEKKNNEKFEETANLGVMRRRGRKWMANEIVEEVAFAVVERKSGFQYSASSARMVSCRFSLPWSRM